MAAWQGWETGRVVLVLCGVLLAGVWVQLTLMHLGGAFKRWQMWAPVIYTPFAALAVTIAALTRRDPWGWLAVVLLVGIAAEGLAGLFFHLQGMSYQVGGIRSLRNVVSGPPPLLPVAYALVGVLGIVAVVWDA
jgi:hypothetical protein